MILPQMPAKSEALEQIDRTSCNKSLNSMTLPHYRTVR